MFIVVFSFCCIVLPGLATASDTTDSSRVTTDAADLQNRILTDDGIMAIVQALQDDPDIKAVLEDPKLMAAIKAGDTNTLMTDPRFMRLMANPRVQEIAKHLEKPNLQ
jgi:hypothetical protein